MTSTSTTKLTPHPLLHLRQQEWLRETLVYTERQAKNLSINMWRPATVETKFTGSIPCVVAPTPHARYHPNNSDDGEESDIPEPPSLAQIWTRARPPEMNNRGAERDRGKLPLTRSIIEEAPVQQQCRGWTHSIPWPRLERTICWPRACSSAATHHAHTDGCWLLRIPTTKNFLSSCCCLYL